MLDEPKEEEYQDLVFVTATEELFIPVRVYYDIHDADLLRKALGKLKCVVFDEKDNNRFVIFYGGEVKNLGLNMPYSKVPKELQPVRLATCTILATGALCCDIESRPRAEGIMRFLGKHIPSSLMEITAVAVSNKILAVKKHWSAPGTVVPYYGIFKDDTMYHNYNFTDEEIEDIGVKDSEYSAEKFYIRYDKLKREESLDWITIRLGLKEKMLFEHVIVGNITCTALDILNKIVDETKGATKMQSRKSKRSSPVPVN